MGGSIPDWPLPAPCADFGRNPIKIDSIPETASIPMNISITKRTKFKNQILFLIQFYLNDLNSVGVIAISSVIRVSFI